MSIGIIGGGLPFPVSTGGIGQVSGTGPVLQVGADAGQVDGFSFGGGVGPTSAASLVGGALNPALGLLADISI